MRVTCPKCGNIISDVDGSNVAFMVPGHAEEWSGEEPRIVRCWSCEAIGLEDGKEVGRLQWYLPVYIESEIRSGD